MKNKLTFLVYDNKTQRFRAYVLIAMFIGVLAIAYFGIISPVENFLLCLFYRERVCWFTEFILWSGSRADRSFDDYYRYSLLKNGDQTLIVNVIINLYKK